jgi:hypothetical protein
MQTAQLTAKSNQKQSITENIEDKATGIANTAPGIGSRNININNNGSNRDDQPEQYPQEKQQQQHKIQSLLALLLPPPL